jgi:hypothetical protein
MDGNVELSVHMTCIIGTFENPYTITKHIKQEKTTSVPGGTLIFVNLFVHAKYHRRAWHGITLPPFFNFLSQTWLPQTVLVSDWLISKKSSLLKEC